MDFNPNPKSYASVTKNYHNPNSSLDDSIHNPHNCPVSPPQHFKKDILATFKIITNKITNINNSFIDIKKEFSSIKSQINHIKQRIQHLKQIADNSSSTFLPSHIISTSINNNLKIQTDKLKSFIEDINNHLSEIYASIVTLAKKF